MNIENLNNGYYRLTAENGVENTCTGMVYSEVVCREENIHLYKAA